MLEVFVSANHRLDVLQLDISLGSVLCCDNAVLVVWLGFSIKPLGWGEEKIMSSFTCMNHFLHEQVVTWPFPSLSVG